MEEYLRSLRKQLNGFPPDEQAALMEEIRSHIESGENDPRMGKDAGQRAEKLMKEMGSSSDIGNGFKEIYRPNRLVDYLLIALPYTLSLYLTAVYMQFRPQYPWMDVRLNVIFDLVVLLIGLRRRSAIVVLFWINVAIMQLMYIVLQGVWQPYWYFGLQTILWAIVLIALLTLLVRIVWRYRHEALLVTFAILPLSMELLGTAVWSIQPVSYIYNPLDCSLLIIFLRMQGGNAQLYGTLVTMALFCLPSNRGLRWLALALSGLIMGFGREYLFDYQTGTVAMVALWIYYLYIVMPLAIVGVGWWLDWNRRRQIQLAM